MSHVFFAALLFWAATTGTPLQRLIAILACVTVTAVWTAISWYGLERPFLRLKDRLPYNN